MQDATNEAKVAQVYQALTQVVDPEVGINVVDLGLIYAVDCRGNEIHVRLTLTSAGCPMGDQIVEEAKQAVSQVAEGASVQIELVWEPFWRPDMMSDKAKEILGW